MCKILFRLTDKQNQTGNQSMINRFSISSVSFHDVASGNTEWRITFLWDKKTKWHLKSLKEKQRWSNWKIENFFNIFFQMVDYNLRCEMDVTWLVSTFSTLPNVRPYLFTVCLSKNMNPFSRSIRTDSQQMLRDSVATRIIGRYTCL